MEIASYGQSFTAAFTLLTISRAVRVGPEGTLRISFCPLASSFTLVPPISMARTLYFLVEFEAWDEFFLEDGVFGVIGAVAEKTIAKLTECVKGAEQALVSNC